MLGDRKVRVQVPVQLAGRQILVLFSQRKKTPCLCKQVFRWKTDVEIHKLLILYLAHSPHESTC